MSKIGQQAIVIPDTVTADIQTAKREVNIKGPLGELAYSVPINLEVEKLEDKLVVKRLKEDKKTKSMHGFFRSLLQNAVSGVEKAWQKKLEIVGTGYNVKLQGEDLIFKIGYSHPVVYKNIKGIKFGVEGNNKVVVSSADKQLVGQVAYQIKIIRKPDAYKGKGIRYLGEQLKLKPGKKAKVGAGAGAA